MLFLALIDAQVMKYRACNPALEGTQCSGLGVSTVHSLLVVLASGPWVADLGHGDAVDGHVELSVS